MVDFKAYSARVITKGRIIKISIALLIIAVLLLTNIFKLQIYGYEYYRDKVYEQITTSSKMKATRGTIYDANMNVLAEDRTTWRIFVSSRDIKSQQKITGRDFPDIISRGLSEILGQKYEDIYKKISNSSVLDITLKKNADEDTYKRVLSFISENKLESMVFTEAQSARYYPEGTLAAHTLGFVGSDLQGLYGLEYYYDKELSGIDGYYLYAKDAKGNALPTEYSTYIPPSSGYSLVTTLDSYLQGQLESQLEAIRLNHSVTNRVTGVVMDTKSGAILAMATSSPFDPNSPYELDAISLDKLSASGFSEDSEEYKKYKKELLEVMWSNKAISETYEPGSTFKIVTVSAALDAKVASVSDSFSCHGYMTVGGWHIRCHKKGGHGSGFSLAYGLQMSCNPTMMTVSARLGSDAFYDYVEKYGYFEKTGIDLPSEASTIFHQKENIGATELATASFGQRFKVSVIRHLTSLASIANGGVMVTPYLVDKIIDENGKVIKQHENSATRQVVSSEVANTVADILERGVSGDGGAKNAYVDGYKVAAKTGTSQKFDVLDENGNSYLRIGSTAAFSLSDDGGIAVLIVVDEPNSSVKYGSVVAAPYVSAFLERALPYLGYMREGEAKEITIENYVGCDVRVAASKLKSLGIEYEIVGEGQTVLAQTPTDGEFILSEGSRVILYTEMGKTQYSIVPSLVGMEASEANYALAKAGLNLKIIGIKDVNGKATVISQSVAAGSVVQRESVITLEIIYTDFED